MIARFRLILVTALIGVAAVVRVMYPDFVLPDDTALASWVDALLATVSPAIWAYTYYKTDTSVDSMSENT